MVCNTSEEIVITAERIAVVVFTAMTAAQVRQLAKAGWPINELPGGELACVPKAVAEYAKRVGYDPSHPERSTRSAAAQQQQRQRTPDPVPRR